MNGEPMAPFLLDTCLLQRLLFPVNPITLTSNLERLVRSLQMVEFLLTLLFTCVSRSLFFDYLMKMATRASKCRYMDIEMKTHHITWRDDYQLIMSVTLVSQLLIGSPQI